MILGRIAQAGRAVPPVAVPLVMAALAQGCGDKPVAELIAMGAHVERDLAAAQGDWKAAAPGDRFAMGDGLRTGPAAYALLKVGRGARMKVEAETLIRFSKAAPGAEAEEQTLAVDMGQVTLETGAEPVRLRSAAGVAEVAAGTRLRIGRAEKIARYEVLVGSASLKTEGAEAVELKPGRRIEVNIDTAKIDTTADERTHDKNGGTDAGAALPPDAAVAVAPLVGEKIELDVLVRASRFREGGSSAWKTLAPGHHVVAAQGALDIPAGGRVKIARGDERALLQGRGHFAVGDRTALVRADQGQVSVADAAGDVTVRVPGGSIVVKRGDGDAGGRAEVRVGTDATTDVRVERGVASVVTGRNTSEVHEGERMNVARDGRVTVVGASAGRADVMASAGESFVVHDPRPPTAVGVDVRAACHGDAARVKFSGGHPLEIEAGPDAPAIAVLQPGRHRYDVRCGTSKKRGAGGSVQILRDGGIGELPRSAPASFVDTDGRKYTVLYQNLLPSILVRWPDAPPAPSYVLTVRPVAGGRTQTFTGKTSRHQIGSGRLSEGSHVLEFATTGARPVRSPETTITIGFDNAAPTAVVKTPKDRAFSAGKTITVTGIAMPGWRVSALGAPLALDDKNRFSGEVRTAPDSAALAVRFEHDDRGVHYYLRRTQRSAR